MYSSTNILRWIPLALVAFWASTTLGQSTEEQYLDGLRARGLSQLAEAYCIDQLKRTDLGPVRRADLTIELARSLANRAMSSPGPDRAALWDQAQKVVEGFARADPENSRLPMVRVQGALGLLSRGELALQESELLADRGPALEEARKYLYQAIRGLRDSEQAVEDLMRRRHQLPHGDTSVLSLSELTAMQKKIQYEIARAYRNQAQCYGEDSPDRANALSQAIRLLEPLTLLDPTDPLCFQSRLDLIRCCRLERDFPKANQAAEALLAMEPTAKVKLEVAAEHIRILLAAGQLDSALQMLTQPREIFGVTSPELDYAWIEVYLALAQSARKGNDAEGAKSWEKKATALAEEIERLYGPYWTRRTGMLLTKHFGAAPEGAELGTLVRVAEAHFRSGSLDEALVAYDKAKEAAAKQGNADRAFELGYVAAAIENQREHFDRALVRFRDLAIGFSQNPKAPEAHQMAVYLMGQSLKKQPDAPLEPYLRLMQEHLETWPDAPSADQVRFQLGKMREFRRDWQAATDLYKRMSPSDPLFLDAVKAAARCYEAWLAAAKVRGEPTEAVAGDAAGWFESLLVDPQGRLPEKWSPIQRLAALEAARLRLNYTPSGYAAAQQVLSAALRNTADAPPDWIPSARALLVFSLAGQGRMNEAAAVLAQISSGPTEQLLSLLEGLSRVAKDAPPQVTQPLAELQLRTIDLLVERQSQLSPDDKRNFERVRAKALASSGRGDDALTQYENLARKYPQDATVQEEYLRLLMERNDRASLEKALAKCREMESKSPPQSPLWFQTKYNVALLRYRLGDKQQAAKMIRLLQLLHPELGGPTMRAKFESLLRECQ